MDDPEQRHNAERNGEQQSAGEGHYEFAFVNLHHLTFHPRLAHQPRKDYNTMAFLTSEQKQALGPFLHIGIFLIALCGGVAINTVFGGPQVPVISEFSAIVLGVIGGLVIHKSLTK